MSYIVKKQRTRYENELDVGAYCIRP